MNLLKRRQMLLRLFLITALICGSVQLSQAQTTGGTPSSAAQTFTGYLDTLGLGWLVDYFYSPPGEQAQTAQGRDGTCPPCNVDPH